MAHFADQALLAEGWAKNVRLTIQAGKIATINPDSMPEPEDRKHAILLPGMPNLHSHAFQRAMAGLSERRGPGQDRFLKGQDRFWKGQDRFWKGQDSFWTWREQMYRFALKMQPEDVEAVASQLYVQMLEAGFTRVGEFHYLHHDPDGHPYADMAEMSGRIAAAAQASGIGLTLLPVFYAHSGFGGQEPGPGQRRFICDLAGFARLLEGARTAIAPLDGAVLGIAPHSLRAVTPEELIRLLPLAPSGPIHLHIAEQSREVTECLAVLAARPVEWLLANAPVDARWCLVHATQMRPHETRALARSGAVAGLCPITEANLGDGIFNGRDYAKFGGRFGIGSDSNVEISLSGELRLFEYGQRLRYHRRNVMGAPQQSTGATLFAAALRGGAQALGGADFPRRGGPADFITLRASLPDSEPPKADTILDQLIFAPGTLDIDAVVVGGKVLVESGRHVARAAVAAKFNAAMRRLCA